MTHFRKLVYKLRANATELQSTITSTIQKTLILTDSNKTDNYDRMTDNQQYLFDSQ